MANMGVMRRVERAIVGLLLTVALAGLAWTGRSQELAVSTGETGRSGGRIVIARRAEPKTLNPIGAIDVGSREILSLTMADLVHIDRSSFEPGPALAEAWTISGDRKRYTLRLRRGVRFSDGHPFDADDVLFTFRVHLDEKIRSPQRELLIIRGRPIDVRKVDSLTVAVDLATPQPVAERIFDSIGILPRHLLEKSYLDGSLASRWGLTTPPSQMAGLGPFRLKEYVPGQHVTLERNPYYWKVDRSATRLPYLAEIVFTFAGSEDGQVLRFLSGEADLIDGLSPDNFAAIARGDRAHGYRVQDVGPGFEYTFLLFNQNDTGLQATPSIRRSGDWFRRVAFRQAVSTAIDRDAIVRLVYQGKATPLWAHVTPGNSRWVSREAPHAPYSTERGRELLRAAGFSWNPAHALVDPSNNEVAFSILTSAGNSQRQQIATLIQDDLKRLGIKVSVVPLDFRAMVDRVFTTYQYEAAVMTLASGDADPNSEMNVWTTNGSSHLWNLTGKAAAPWETEIDELMRLQQVSLDYAERKRLYDRVQQLVALNLPMVCLVSPHVLIGASARIRNLRPSLLRPYVLGNADEVFVNHAAQGGR